MAYRIELSEQAEAELEAAYLYLADRSAEAALRWFRNIRAAILSLGDFPRRCALAPENELITELEIRQLVYGAGRGTYRILYTIAADEQEIRILHIRHAARRLMGPGEEI